MDVSEFKQIELDNLWTRIKVKTLRHKISKGKYFPEADDFMKQRTPPKTLDPDAS